MTLARCGPAPSAGSPAHGLHDPALVTLPVAIFLIGALVVLFLAFGEPDFELGAAFLCSRDRGGGTLFSALSHGHKAAISRASC
jgi:hypothetical protein